MGREIKRLTAKQVATLPAGLHADGDGLYMQVTAAGARSWIYRYRALVTGRLRDMGLGPVRDIPLARARELAEEARRQRRDGIDPIDTRRETRAAANTDRTWGDAVDDYITARRAEWRSSGRGKRVKGMGAQENQWRQSLADHGPPAELAVNRITTEVVLAALRPIWQARDDGGKPETATRVRGRIERIWEAERVAGNVAGENPARWNGLLEHLLPSAEKLKRERHHAALPYAHAPALYSALRFRTSKSARALRFLLLTASRTQEVVGMPDLSEIDFEERLWRIPAARMKADVDHEVPLVPEALELLRGLPIDQPPFQLSENAMLMLLQRAPPKGLGLRCTVHGLRSTFRDWVSETTGYPREVAEMALAHQIRDKVEAAYRRGNLRDKRRQLMADWLAYLQHGGQRRASAQSPATATGVRP